MLSKTLLWVRLCFLFNVKTDVLQIERIFLPRTVVLTCQIYIYIYLTIIYSTNFESQKWIIIRWICEKCDVLRIDKRKGVAENFLFTYNYSVTFVIIFDYSLPLCLQGKGSTISWCQQIMRDSKYMVLYIKIHSRRNRYRTKNVLRHVETSLC